MLADRQTGSSQYFAFPYRRRSKNCKGVDSRATLINCFPQQVCVQPSTAAVNVTLPALLLTAMLWCAVLLGAGGCCTARLLQAPVSVQQSIDVSCPPGPQQQTRRMLLQRSIAGTDRRAYGRRDRQTDGHRTVTQTLPHTMRTASLS